MSYVRDLKYTIEHRISFEDLGFLKTLHWIANPTGSVKEQEKIKALIYKEYHLHADDGWNSPVNPLKELGFLLDYRMGDERYFLNLEKLRLTSKFQETYFLDAELAYEEAKSVYPSLMNVPNGGTRSTMLARHEELREYYYNQVIDGGDPEAHARFLRITGEMFKAGKKKKNAEVGFNTFLQSFKDLARAFEEKEVEKEEYQGFNDYL